MMRTQAVWADYKYLDEISCFMFTNGLFDLETALGKTAHDSIHWSRRFEYPWIYTNLQPFDSNDIVLDAGAGRTALQFLISPQVKEMHSIDTDPSSVEWANTICRGVYFPNVFPKIGDISHIPFPNSYFDKVICISVLEHQPRNQILSIIDELLRVVKPGGKLIITMDIAFETTDKQLDIDGLRSIMSNRVIIPDLDENSMSFKTDSYDFPFSVLCMLFEKENEIDYKRLSWGNRK